MVNDIVPSSNDPQPQKGGRWSRRAETENRVRQPAKIFPGPDGERGRRHCWYTAGQGREGAAKQAGQVADSRECGQDGGTSWRHVSNVELGRSPKGSTTKAGKGAFDRAFGIRPHVGADACQGRKDKKGGEGVDRHSKGMYYLATSTKGATSATP